VIFRRRRGRKSEVSEIGSTGSDQVECLDSSRRPTTPLSVLLSFDDCVTLNRLLVHHADSFPCWQVDRVKECLVRSSHGVAILGVCETYYYAAFKLETCSSLSPLHVSRAHHNRSLYQAAARCLVSGLVYPPA